MQGGCQLFFGVYCLEEGCVVVVFVKDWMEGVDFYEFEGEYGEELVEIIVDMFNELEEM